MGLQPPYKTKMVGQVTLGLQPNKTLLGVCQPQSSEEASEAFCQLRQTLGTSQQVGPTVRSSWKGKAWVINFCTN